MEIHLHQPIIFSFISFMKPNYDYIPLKTDRNLYHQEHQNIFSPIGCSKSESLILIYMVLCIIISDQLCNT